MMKRTGSGQDRHGNSRERDNEFEQKILDLARVTRVTAGGKRMRFRCCLIVGDRKGQVGYGIAKGADVQLAVAKAFNKAKKRVVTVPLVAETIPHAVRVKFGSAVLLMKPAPAGSGIKAGGPLRVVLELAGVPNIVGKMLGSGNKINNVRATFLGLDLLRRHEAAANKRHEGKLEAIKKSQSGPKTKELEATLTVTKNEEEV